MLACSDGSDTQSHSSLADVDTRQLDNSHFSYRIKLRRSGCRVLSREGEVLPVEASASAAACSTSPSSFSLNKACLQQDAVLCFRRGLYLCIALLTCSALFQNCFTSENPLRLRSWLCRLAACFNEAHRTCNQVTGLDSHQACSCVCRCRGRP